jgi:hypothetical protein
MKALTVLMMLTAAVLVHGAKAFEGSYVMEMSADGETFETAIWVKDGHVRMKMTSHGAPGEMIMRDGMKTMLVVMPAQKMYMEMPLEMKDLPTVEVPDKEKKLEKLPFEKTGEKRTIGGHEAHEFVYQGEDGKMIIWATDELGSMPFSRNPMMEGWAKAMSKVTGLESFFPLEMAGHENGRVAYRMTVKDIEKKALPDSLFEPPAGFRKMTMPAGMGGFMQR